MQITRIYLQLKNVYVHSIGLHTIFKRAIVIMYSWNITSISIRDVYIIFIHKADIWDGFPLAKSEQGLGHQLETMDHTII